MAWNRQMDRLQTNKLQHFIALIQCTLATRWHSNNDWSLFMLLVIDLVKQTQRYAMHVILAMFER